MASMGMGPGSGAAMSDYDHVVRLVLFIREAQAHGPDGGAVLFELVLEMEARVHALLEWQQG